MSVPAVIPNPQPRDRSTPIVGVSPFPTARPHPALGHAWPALACVAALTLAYTLDAIVVSVAPPIGPLAAWPWLIALVVFGMPHGAADWVVHRADRRHRGRSRGLLSFTGYLVWMAAAAASLYLAPLLTVAGFFVLTAFHFGMADATHALGSSHTLSKSDRSAWWTLGVCRGALVLAIPFAMDPAGAWLPFAVLTQIGVTELGLPVTTLQALAGVAAAVLLLALIGALVRLRPGVWRQSRHWFVLESVAAVALLALTPPLFAVGAYFLCIHAPKHTLRLSMLDRWISPGRYAAFPGAAKLPARLLHVHRESLALWPLSIAIILAWALLLPDGLTATTVAAASIGFYIVTTLPHHLLGTRLPGVPGNA
ncbi:MAG: beta-carotene 15,15'-dioxygenase, Brp/Blh family [Planctomycetota bacterium]